MKKILQLLYNNIEEYILYILLIIMGVSMLVQIFCRYFLGNPLIWPEELARMCFVWMAMVGSGFCIKNKLNTRITLLIDVLPAKAQKIINVIVDVFCIAIFVYLIPTSLRFISTQKELRTPALNWPMTFFYGSLYAAIVLIVIRYSIEIYELITGKKAFKFEEKKA